MLYILLTIGLILFIIGLVKDEECLGGPGLVILIAAIGAILIVVGTYNYRASTIDSRLAVLEEQNTTVLTQVEPLVQQALNYESSTYKDLKLDVNKLIIFAQMYPQLKSK